MRLSSDGPLSGAPMAPHVGALRRAPKQERRGKEGEPAATGLIKKEEFTEAPVGAPVSKLEQQQPKKQQQQQQQKKQQQQQQQQQQRVKEEQQRFKDPRDPQGLLSIPGGPPRVRPPRGGGGLATSGRGPPGPLDKGPSSTGGPLPREQHTQTPRRSKRYETLLEVKNPMEVEGEEEFLSDSDEERNRIGNVPLWWYDKYKHIGYDIEGNKVEKTIDQSALGSLLQSEAADSWRYVKDIRNDRLVRLSDADLGLISRIRDRRYPDPHFSEGEYYIESDLEDRQGTPARKAQFLPSLHEQKKINRYIKLIREGRLQQQTEQKKGEEELRDLWGSSIFSYEGKHKQSLTAKAPKMQLPGHAESYNPPEEYLFTPEVNVREEAEWKAMPEESRPISFIPRKFSCLRRVPAYANLLLERYNRCLDLYLLVAAAADGNLVAAGSSDGCLRVFETLTGRLVSALLLQQQITAAAFHPRLPILAVAAAEQLLLIALDVPVFDGESLQHLTAAGAAAGKKKRSAAAAAAAAEASGGEETGGQGQLRRDLAAALDLLLVRTAANSELPDLLQTAEAETTNTTTTTSSSSSSSTPYVVEATVGSKLIGCWQQVSMRHAKAAAKAAAKEVDHQQQQQQQQQEQQQQEAHEPTLLLRGVKRAVFVMHEAPILRLKWQPKGNYLAAVCPGSSSPHHQLLIHNLKKQTSIRPFRKRGPGALRDVVFHPDKPWLVVAYTRGLRIYDLAAKQTSPGVPGSRQALVKKLLGADSATSVDVHQSGSHLIVGGENGKLYVFDIELSARVFKIFRSHAQAITQAVFHPALPLMATSSLDGTVQIYHFRTFEDLSQNALIVPVKTIQVCQDSKAAAAAAADRTGGCHLWR
ncbi:hypothetical protein Efla_001442 [Eimeria flavescens]